MAVLLGGIGSTKTSIPAKLKSFVDSKGLHVAPITFRGYGKVSKGYVIFNSRGDELVEIEPYFGYGKSKWKMHYQGEIGSYYMENISQLVNKMKRVPFKLSDTGYVFRDYKQYI